MIGLSQIKNIKTSEALAKTAGCAALVLGAYDCHSAGAKKAAMTEKDSKAEVLADAYLADMKSDSPSVVKSGLKGLLFKYKLDENITGFFHNVGGYFKGFGSMMLNGIVPLGLATGAIIGKGAWSKAFGLGLAAYGGIFLLREGLGIGKAHE